MHVFKSFVNVCIAVGDPLIKRVYPRHSVVHVSRQDVDPQNHMS